MTEVEQIDDRLEFGESVHSFSREVDWDKSKAKRMKFFVSGKVASDGEVRQAIKMLRDAGHEITFDWTTIGHLKPYDQNIEASRQAALLESEGVKNADVLVIIAHERGVGMFVELGIAIGLGIPVRVVSNEESRTMFFHHPLVKKIADIRDVIREFS